MEREGGGPGGIDVRWAEGSFFGWVLVLVGGGKQGLEGLTEKAERRLKLIEGMSTGRRAGGERGGLVTGSVLRGACVCVSV